MIRQFFLNKTTFPSLILSLPLEGGGKQGEGETPQKRNCFLSIFFLFLLFPALTFATPQVPRTIVFQGILVDAGGNPLTDVSSANADISIVDGAGNLRYEEQQTITIFQGATAFLVGTGTSLDTGEPTGGIPLDVMEPGEGDLILKIKIEGQTIAQEDVIFASVPFSFYSQYATELTQPIESKQIKDGAITVSHLSEEVTTYVKSLGVSKEELEAHKTEEAAHTGKNIAVENTFRNLIGTDLQMLMESVDYQITLANKASGQIAAGSVGAEELDMSVFNGWDQNTSDDLTTSTVFGGAITGVYNSVTLVDNTVHSSTIVDGSIQSSDLADGSVTAAKLAESYLPITGGTLTGDLVMENTDIVMSDNYTVDGVDVSALAEKVNKLFDGDNDDGETIDPVNIDQSIKPYAYGVVDHNGIISNGYGTNSVEIDYTGRKFMVEFSTPRSDTNYTVSLTSINFQSFGGGPSIPYPCFPIIEKDTDGFTTYFICGASIAGKYEFSRVYSIPDSFDFIVFVNGK